MASIVCVQGHTADLVSIRSRRPHSSRDRVILSSSIVSVDMGSRTYGKMLRSRRAWGSWRISGGISSCGGHLLAPAIVGVHSDELVTQLTGRAPVVPLSERLALVAHVRGVDEVLVHEAGSGPADPDTVLFVDGDLPSSAASNLVRLDSVRFTESAALRLALEPVGEAVA